MSNEMIHIIGSGPSGIACANALVDQGLNVTMIDAGIELEAERKQFVSQLEGQLSEAWDPDTIKRMKDNTDADIGGVQLKTSYGSVFPYEGMEAHAPLERVNVACLPTFAKGGFSNVWGANVLPYRSEDIEDWPISLDDLIPHYDAVFNFLDLAAEKDDLETLFPLYTDRYHSLESSRQTSALLDDLNNNKTRLRESGFTFGRSRLAVRSKSTTKGFGCACCGLCLYGCPYHLIYESSRNIDSLSRHPNFNYVRGVVVEKIKESNFGIKISCYSRLNGERVEYESARVYLACGPLSSTRILLESLEAYDRSVVMKDSQYFLLPCLRYQGISKIEKEKVQTLSQIYVELLDEKLSKNTIHLQLYMYNDMYVEAIKRVMRWSYQALRQLTKPIVARLILIQGYLHSDSSNSFSVSLKQTKNSKKSTLVLKANTNKRAEKVIQAVVKKLFQSRSLFKMIPLLPGLKIAEVGRGFHCGGSFPMREKPSDFECDTLGRPNGFKKVHVVDSTTFPSIPASTITLTSMANAHRIASAHKGL